MSSTRREFLSRSAMAAATAGLAANPTAFASPVIDDTHAKFGSAKKPVIITRHTNLPTVGEAYQMLLDGGDTLDAALHICKGQEDDPTDDTVGLGGLPNEEGVVELDSCCMHGPSRRAGSVAAVQNIKNACLLAKTVMQRTGHVMLAGEGAQRFAVAEGFPKENLLTDRSRKIWLLWKETMSNEDWWGPGLDSPEWKAPEGLSSSGEVSRRIPRNPLPSQIPMLREQAKRLYAMAADIGIAPADRQHAVNRLLFPSTGTIHVSAVNTKGEISGATTTSGLEWKIPGRVGDSPIIGAGCYTDQDVGSAGATGSGEENIKVAGAHSIIDLMRQGMPPKEAGLETLRRIARNFNNDMNKLRYVDMQYYILRRDGAYAGVSLWSTGYGRSNQFLVHDGTQRMEDHAALFQGSYIEWPVVPEVNARSFQK
ncbi:MAG TPA: isoaspartyl peptidase/L-asparaginase [Acidobacteriaceae bacterium]|nr:isoaspartyl peptidase/L-asparaginase [Acidobacteriaceae bacterium]